MSTKPATKTTGGISRSDLEKMTVSKDSSGWDSIPGETFGGDANILKLEVDQVAGPLEYDKLNKNALVIDGENVDVHTARDSSTKLWRLPLAASFRKQVEESKLSAGDVFWIRRAPDAIKRKGKGKGNPMRIFQIKITQRAGETA